MLEMKSYLYLRNTFEFFNVLSRQGCFVETFNQLSKVYQGCLVVHIGVFDIQGMLRREGGSCREFAVQFYRLQSFFR